MPYTDLSLPFMRNKTYTSALEHVSEKLLNEVDIEVAQAWQVMKKFSTLINLATQAERKISKDTLLETMASVMYRLLHMRFTFGSVSETIRLGLLAFSSHVFLQWRDIKPSYLHFPTAYRHCLVDQEASARFSPQIMLWLLMIGAISVFTGADDEWLIPCLRAHIRLCEAEQWNEMRDILKSFMWIDCLHGKPGKTVLDSVVS